ncbi:MAG: PEP-CTERM sorting domain-containing protein [Opitutaceae bacterium]|nr:PEP-CTERM sorting domain-containing protein [Cephaloticoccus sp.]MCP5528996.1 PEP-CTERM sorting domain-containing protein [Opitutaceae bacterium]
MKILRGLGFVSAWALLIGTTAFAQVEGVFIGKSESNVQTDATTVIVNPTPPSAFYGGAYGFTVSVEGTGLSAPTVTLPGNATIPTADATSHNSGELGFNPQDNEWAYGSPNFNNWGAQSAAEIDTLFGTGTYTVTVPVYGAVDLALNTSLADIATIISSAPLFTLSGGTWSNGTYYVDPSQSVTITTNTFAEYGDNAAGHIDFSVQTNGGPQLYQGEYFSTDNPTDNFITYTIDPGTLISGQTYTVYAAFASILELDNAIADALSASFLERSTAFLLQAVPEPSTYAALTGLAVLAVVVWRKRRFV